MQQVFLTGVYHDIKFDLCIGVSAVIANVTADVTKQHGRIYRFYADYSFRKNI